MPFSDYSLIRNFILKGLVDGKSDNFLLVNNILYYEDYKCPVAMRLKDGFLINNFGNRAADFLGSREQILKRHMIAMAKENADVCDADFSDFDFQDVKSLKDVIAKKI